jgi:hypothetical protein
MAASKRTTAFPGGENHTPQTPSLLWLLRCGRNLGAALWAAVSAPPAVPLPGFAPPLSLVPPIRVLPEARVLPRQGLSEIRVEIRG